jgi:hypothetical protein
MALWDDAQLLLFGHGLDGPECACGCGLPVVTIAQQTRRDIHHQRGEPTPYRPGHNGRWRGPLAVIDLATGCWVWQRSTINGYGIVRVDGIRKELHRLVWEKLRGPVPPGHHLHHSECRNRACFFPPHLRPLSPPEHARLHNDERRAR